MSVTLEDVKNRINRVKKLILKKISDDIKKREKRIPTEDEVIKIYEKRRAEHEKYVEKLAKKQEYIAKPKKTSKSKNNFPLNK
jgi:hypothetical protein